MEKNLHLDAMIATFKKDLEKYGDTSDAAFRHAFFILGGWLKRDCPEIHTAMLEMSAAVYTKFNAAQ